MQFQNCPCCEGHGTLVDENCYACFGSGIDNDWVREKEDDEPPLCEPCDGYGFGTECPTCEGQGELKREAQEPKPVGSLEHVSSIIPDLLKHLDDDK